MGKVTLNITIQPELKRDLALKAEEMGISISSLLAVIFHQWKELRKKK